MYCVVLCLIVFGCQYQCNWLPGKTRLWNDLLCVEWDVKPYTLTHSLSTTTTRIEKIWRSDCLKLQRNYLVGHSIVYFVAWATVSALHALFVLFRTLLVATVLQCPVGQIKLLIDWLISPPGGTCGFYACLYKRLNFYRIFNALVWPCPACPPSGLLYSSVNCH